ncbi:bifunctional demethylmenaquinone methyltransferase/2-methoxy-6-polyprenyl-1,4-benzoquinol methylase UbiE [Desulfosarcina ovata]|uniref:Demethylmenaquinone methyltransferase n=2 Tax=Desulfosarcina ovata TaxID=83564 RepID=A0A5K8AD44_9BACT|nr:bifunctional demethylmenaquinone methyltransferase/2-methoxy-6-polyprenyl-1,4-benzoquinol methylase UbiE [Desulfosarcina ovata]BBO83971.1 ubiquinone/menaquinone biosynthesis C-methyltransferase UbiE [Desulfosarcina ovata subsp. sediminis]BBO90449.1 ubiquinone/menaquinone biosynthesis C-methyltransferase UbiE [Desulfosarcina ovata subsp. ovata]
MALWQNPRWFDGNKRQEQLDDYIRATGKARFGIREFAEENKAEAVRIHFDRVAPKYDFMNSLLSFGIQHAWKRAAVRMLGVKPGDRVLDVCGGTGDLAILAARRSGPAGQVVIFDINLAMIQAGRHKIDPYPDLSHISYVQGNAEAITFPDNTFDCAMVGFGIRNVTHLKTGFSEMIRVLKPGGRLLCLEFSRPLNPVFRSLYDFYSFNIMPALGQLLAGSAESYACLPETIRMFPLPGELAAMLTDLGLRNVNWEAMTNGISVAHVGSKR